MGKRTRCSEGYPTYLCRVHLELADDLDGDLAVLALAVLRAVDVAESAIAHLLNECVPLQSRVAGQLALALTLFGNNTLEHRVILLLLLALALLPVVDRIGGGVAGPGGLVLVIYRSGGEILSVLCLALQGLVWRDIGLAGGGVVALVSAAMLLRVDIGDVCCGLVLGRAGFAGLLPVPYEVLEVLDRRHG